jgi:hypothetical protein
MVYERTLGLLTITTLVLGACSRPRAAIPSPPFAPNALDWIDLEPGWRVRVVLPIRKSGDHSGKSNPVEADSAERAVSHAGTSQGAVYAMTLSSLGVVGYEVFLYKVKARQGGGIRMVFGSAEIHQENRVTRAREPFEPLSHLPKEARWVRILHLARGGHDYDAAILATDRRDALDALTRKVELDASACRFGADAFCYRVPPGVAAIPESRKNGKREWVSMMEN